MVIKYTNILHSKALKKASKLGFFGLKIVHLATLILSVKRTAGDRLTFFAGTLTTDEISENRMTQKTPFM
jgi:hypothetical protein